MVGGKSVVANTTKGNVWYAFFVGPHGAKGSITSSSKCNRTEVTRLPPPALALSFKWIDCELPFDNEETNAHDDPPASWVKHEHSTCGGRCLSKHSNGPRGGNCDRMPGCGHDAGLPYCEPDAMKARCLNASGCTAFNTNGYLYSGNRVDAFNAYPLDCYTYGPPPPPPALINVTLTATLRDGILEYGIAFDGTGEASLWDYSVILPNVKTTDSMAVVQSQAAKQLSGLYDTNTDTPAPAVYFAAHDPKSIVKHCGKAGSDTTLHTMTLQCNMLALNATLPLHHYQAAFPIAVSVLEGDWWDVASRYRAWVLPNAEWTKFGPLEQRTDLPPWLENITLWMNNNWGGDPLRPNYGGDPEHVKLEMLAVNSVLDLPSHGGHLALHWYEWDTLGYALGSNHTKCDRHPAPCGFDTHYPNYFPARVGCSAAIKAMQAEGMRVIPYINGQLYDTLIPRFKADDAMAAVQKYSEQSMRTPDHQPTLTPHLEHFDGITSAVICPATDYWRSVMRDTIVKAVNDIGFDGVYVDQVGNGEQRNCGDPSHNHTINGGSFWAESFYAIMADVRASVPPSMFMTEGTVEEVSGAAFDILLGLDWKTLPYWSAIYGGYGYATGWATTGAPLTGGLLDMLTSQFMVGGTMGWFTYQNQGNAFLDPKNKAEIAYIQLLSRARIAAKKWMVHGRATRSLDLHSSSAPTDLKGRDTGLEGAPTELKGASTGLKGSAPTGLKGGCFLRDKKGEQASVVCAVAVTKTAAPITFALDIDPAKYGLTVPSGSPGVAVTDLLTGSPLGTFKGNVKYSDTLNAYELRLVLLTVK